MEALPVSTERVARRSSQRNDLIQVLRFVAAALVLVTHLTSYYHERITSSVVDALQRHQSTGKLTRFVPLR